MDKISTQAPSYTFNPNGLERLRVSIRFNHHAQHAVFLLKRPKDLPRLRLLPMPVPGGIQRSQLVQRHAPRNSQRSSCGGFSFPGAMGRHSSDNPHVPTVQLKEQRLRTFLEMVSNRIHFAWTMSKLSSVSSQNPPQA